MSSEIDAILTRLQLCNADIASITTSFKEPPREIFNNELPLSYAVWESLADEPITSTGDVQVYVFSIEVAIVRVEEQGIDSAGVSAAMKLVTTIADDMAEYYRNHRQLSTNTLAPLNLYTSGNNAPGIRFSARAAVPFPAHDGQSYIGLIFQISVPMLIDTETEY